MNLKVLYFSIRLVQKQGPNTSLKFAQLIKNNFFFLNKTQKLTLNLTIFDSNKTTTKNSDMIANFNVNRDTNQNFESTPFFLFPLH